MNTNRWWVTSVSQTICAVAMLIISDTALTATVLKLGGHKAVGPETWFKGIRVGAGSPFLKWF